jgi:signal transduction histidine kinase
MSGEEDGAQEVWRYSGASRGFRELQWRRLLAVRVAAVLVAVGLALLLLPDDSREGLFALIMGGIYLPVSTVLHLIHQENPRPPSPWWFLSLASDVTVVALVLALFPLLTAVSVLGLTLIVIVNAQFFGSRWGMVVGAVAWGGVLGPTVFRSPGDLGTFGAVFSGPLLIAVGFVVGTLADDERRAAARSRLLAEAIASVGSSMELEESLRVLCRAACRGLAARFAVVLAREKGPLTLLAGSEERDGLGAEARRALRHLLDDADEESAPTPLALRTGTAVVVPDMERGGGADGLRDLIRQAQVASMAAVPIIRGERPIAVLNVYLPGVHRFSQDERGFLEAIAEHAAIAFERARMYSQEKENAARLREADRMKSEFVATVSHELRTPLTGIIGFALTLRNRWRDLSGELRDELLQRVEENGRSLEHLITHLLDFSRLERGQFRIEVAPQDASALVRKVLQNMAHELEGHTVIVSAGRDVEVMSDPYAFERVLGNLLSNAAKFSPTGTAIRISVSPEGELVRLAVRDEGPGVPADAIDRIFERFYRGTDGSVRGAGIGLTVVKELVELQGGRVEVANADPGAVFTVFLPRPQEGEAAAAERPEPEDEETEPDQRTAASGLR